MQISLTISCTWAGQSTDQTTLDIIQSVCVSVVTPPLIVVGR